MVDSTKACESSYMDVDLVQNSKKKQIVIMGAGAYVLGQFGEKLEIPIEIDGKAKTWSPNRDSANNLNRAYGADTQAWIGKVVNMQLITKNGKVTVLGVPDLA